MPATTLKALYYTTLSSYHPSRSRDNTPLSHDTPQATSTADNSRIEWWECVIHAHLTLVW